MRLAQRFYTILIAVFGVTLGTTQAWADAENLTATDVRGSSQLCKDVREGRPPSTVLQCRADDSQEYQRKLKFETESLAFKTAVENETSKTAGEIKRELIRNAVANFAESVAEAKRITGQDPFATNPVQHAEVEMLKACGSGAGNFNADITALLKKAKAPNVSQNKDLAALNRYATAMLEYDRITRLLEDNYFKGDEKIRMTKRRLRILTKYPMVRKGSHLGLKQVVTAELGLRGNDNSTPSETQDWLDGYLFEDLQPPVSVNKGRFPISYEAAMALNRSSDSSSISKEVSTEFMLNTKAALKSLAGLCSADNCTTLNISHEITASSLQRRRTVQQIQNRSVSLNFERRKFNLLLNGVCECKLLEPQTVASENTVMSMGLVSLGALAICVSNILMPNPTLVLCGLGAAGSASAIGLDTANSAIAIYDSQRTGPAAKVSESLPGLNDQEKKKLLEFQQGREAEVATKLALTAAAAPITKLAGAGFKAGLSKVKEIKTKRLAGSTEAPRIERRQVDASPVEAGGLRPQTKLFVETNGSKEATTEAQRLKFNEKAKRIDSGEEKGIIIATETSPLREINHFLGKELGDALSNFHNELLVKKLLRYQEEHPGLLLEMSHNYKGFFHIPHGKVPAGYSDDYKKILSEVYGEMFDHLVKNKVLRSSELALIQKMRNTGVGETFQEATDARKLAKELTPEKNDNSGSLPYSSSSVQESIKMQQSYTDYYRTEIQQKLGETPLMESVESSGKKVPTREVLAIIKKSKDPEKIRQALNHRYPGTNIDDPTLKKLKMYNELIEEQNPSQYPLVSREKASLTDAENGGIASDTISMGSYNSSATAKALATADGVASAKQQIRIEEQKVTDKIRNEINPHYKENAKSIFPNSKASISGDEKVILFSKESSLNSLKKFVRAHAEDPGLQRHSFIPPGVPKEMRNLLVEDGLKIDKVLRDELMKTALPFEKTGSLNSLIMMETKDFGKGQVSIIIGQKPGSPSLTKKDLAEIEKAFEESLRKFNEAEPGFKPKTSYRPGVIHRAD
jgi:hypothetical protein